MIQPLHYAFSLDNFWVFLLASTSEIVSVTLPSQKLLCRAIIINSPKREVKLSS